MVNTFCQKLRFSKSGKVDLYNIRMQSHFRRGPAVLRRLFTFSRTLWKDKRYGYSAYSYWQHVYICKGKYDNLLAIDMYIECDFKTVFNFFDYMKHKS